MLKKMPKKQKKQTLFSKKWANVEKKQTRNLNYKNKINALYQQFQIDVLPSEHQLCEAMAQETRHLMGFISRKSFTNWQREELTLWIESNLDTLAQHPFTPPGLAQVVHEEYEKHCSDNSELMDEDEVIDSFHIIEMRNLLLELEIDDEFSDEQFSEFFRNPHMFTDYIEKKMEERHNQEQKDEYTEEELDDSFFEDIEDDFINSDYFQHFQQTHQKHQKKLKDLFNASVLKKCYKKLANVLHPDKEQNPDLKEQKSNLMGILVQAKKEKDAFTIISMYQEHIPDNDLNLDKDVSTELIELINDKLQQLDSEYRELKDEPSIENMIWEKLGDRSKKEMAKKQALHLYELQQGCDGIQQNIINSKNMKQLNKQLSQRYDMRHQNPFSNLDSFESFIDEMDEDAFFSNFPFK